MMNLITLQKWQININTNKQIILGFVCLMVSTYLFANSVCFPALPSMRNAFAVTPQTIQYIIILYTFGLGVSQIVYGPLSDVYGRRRLALLGTLILLAGSIVILLSASLYLLFFGRLLQGIGAGCYSVLGKSITSDIYDREQYINASIIVMIISVLTQIIAPMIGGYLNELFSWHVNFIAIVCYSFITFITLLFLLPETKAIKQETGRFSFIAIYHNYQLILKDPIFWCLLLISAFTLGNIAIYQIISPFILQDQMHISSIQYGWATFCSASGFLIGNCCIPSLNRRFLPQKNILFGLIIMSVGASLMLILAYWDYAVPIAIILPMLFFNIGAGITFPLATAGALLKHRNMAGSAGAITGSLQMLIVAIITLICSHIVIKNQYSLALPLLALTNACFLFVTSYQFFWKNHAFIPKVFTGENHEA